jgi:molybdate transport system substrate-binding protein
VVEAGQVHRNDGQLSRSPGGALAVLSAGAAQSVVTALARAHGIELQAEFGAVGAMRQRLLEGAPCDLVVLTRALIDELTKKGFVTASADLGRVPTCLAVREGDPLPDPSLAKALQGKDVYFPDPEKATAGAHVRKVLDQLGIQVNPKIFPNGATAMRALAKATGNAIGCTQATEILATPGIKLAAPLAGEFALETMYSAGICRDSPTARRFLELLLASRDLRMEAGFQL